MEKKYSKPILSVRDFVRESGFPKEYVMRAVHCWFADQFCFRTGTAVNSKYMIDTERFEYYHREGEFR